MNKIFMFMEKLAKIYNIFIGIPMMVMALLVLGHNGVSNPIIKQILFWCMGIFTIVYVFVLISLFIRRKASKEFIVWPLVFIVSIFVLSFISKPTRTIEIIQLIMIEAYIIYYFMVCIVKGKINVSLMFLLSIIFISLGFYGIYYYTYHGDTTNNSNDLFNALIAVFSAIIGGAITLGGVGWGIRQNNSDRKEDLVLQSKPIFYAASLTERQRKENPPSLLAYQDKSKNNYYTLRSIANTDNSIVIVRKIVINKKEYTPLNNNLMDKGKVYDIMINAKKITEKSIMYLYTEDVLNNQYIFKIKFFKSPRNEEQEHEKYNILSVEECLNNKETI